ncbi:hypothetical protein BISA_1658 [Bifidobacterium saguini DSM 23967]|nr:hypothetical protein BISA_1658 [Bifidobacterium saguini DSM 23967]
MESQTDAAVSETKVFESVADGSQTQVLPTANDNQQTQVLNVEQQTPDESLTQPMTAIDSESQAAETQVIEPHVEKSADSEQTETDTITLQSVADVEEPDNAESDTQESVAADASSAEIAPETPVQPDLNVPLMEAFAQSADDVPSPQADAVSDSPQDCEEPNQQESSAPDVPAAAAVTASELKKPKHDISVLTVIFGVLGLIIGVIGLLFGWAFPGLLVESFYIDPRMLTAIICGAVGAILVIVAIVWAVLGAKKTQQQ